MKLYYEAPMYRYFIEVKANCLLIWNEYDYSENKLEQIDRMQNIKDNFMYLIAMLDSQQMEKLASTLKEDTKEQIRNRLVSVDNFDLLSIFN